VAARRSRARPAMTARTEPSTLPCCARWFCAQEPRPARLRHVVLPWPRAWSREGRRATKGGLLVSRGRHTKADTRLLAVRHSHLFGEKGREMTCLRCCVTLFSHWRASPVQPDISAI